MSARSPLLEAALTYAEHGYSVFPTAPRGKHPLTANGFKAATRDERDILHRWEEHPDANVGVACGASHIVVLDIDSKAGADPQDILGELDIAGVPLIYTGEAPEPSEKDPNSLSGVRGAHLYFAGDLAGTNKLSIVGCEIRGNQHYVVAPPSVHPSGVVYQGTLPPVAELPPVPDWLPAMIAAPNASAPAVTETIPAGARNATLASIAGTMRRRGMSAKAIAAALQVENEERCRPPLSAEEVEQIAASIARYAAKNSERPSTAARKDAPLAELQLRYDKNGALLELPEKPSLDDIVGLCAWTTVVFGLDRRHPITGGKRRGVRGVAGCVELTRLDAMPLIIDPVTRLNVPLRLSEALTAHRLPSDDAIPPFRGSHCRDVAHVIVMLAGTDEALTEDQETASIIGTLLHIAEEADAKVTCHGSAAQRAEVVLALRHGYDEPIRWLRDSYTGEIVVTVRDLNEVARKHMGGTLRHGWLEARMDSFGWVRRELQGYGEQPDGSRGQHVELGIYRGFLPGADDDS